MPDVLFQQEAVEKAEQLRKEEETQKVRQMEYAELEKRQTERQKRLESIKKTIAAEQTQLGRAEGTKRALEEQLEKEIAEAQKRLLLWRKRILRKERVRGRARTETPWLIRLPGDFLPEKQTETV